MTNDSNKIMYKRNFMFIDCVAKYSLQMSVLTYHIQNKQKHTQNTANKRLITITHVKDIANI